MLSAVFVPVTRSARADEPRERESRTRATLVRVLQDNAVAGILEDATKRHRPRSTTFVDVNLVSVRDGAIRARQTIVVENGRFTAVGSTDSVRIPRNTHRIDGRGKYLVPGLTDMHVHSLVSNSQKLLNLANGVTTIRDMDGFPYLLEERKAIRDNRVLGPNMYVTGTILAAMPMEDYARVVTTPDEARAAVVDQKRQGYDFIKVHNVLPLELYREVLEEAKRQSIDVVGHIPHGIRLEDAIALGQRTLEHLKGYYDDRTLAKTTEDYVGLTKSAAVWNCPTFYTRRTGISRAELERLIASSEEMRYVPAADKRRWLESAKDAADPTTETIFELSVEAFRTLYGAGARFLTGTDSGGGYGNHVPGFALQHELEALESLGMPPVDVLRASTIEAAAAMRREREFGSIEIGMRADCILASKNPLETISNLKAGKGVMVRGVWLSPEAIAELLDRLARVYSNDEGLVGANPEAALNRAVREVRQYERAGFAGRVGRESTLVALGGLLLEAGRARESGDVLRIAANAFPDSANVHAGFAATLVTLERWRDARASVERALTLDPGNEQARRLLESSRLRSPPSFEPVGVYDFETRRYSRGAFKPLKIRLEVTGSRGAYSGRLVSDIAPESLLADVSVVGSRLWATATVGQSQITLRLLVTGGRATGTWSANFGVGRLSGIRETVR